MSLLAHLRGSPPLLRALQACASSSTSAFSLVQSSRQTCSNECPCPCCERQFSTVSLSQQQQEHEEARQESLQEIRARVFDQHAGDGKRSGRKYLLRRLKGPVITDWYMTDIGGSSPLLDDPMETHRVDLLSAHQAKGKRAPKKGQGKRSGKR